MTKATPHYEFGPFRVDVAERVLLRDGEVVPLTPKVFETLLLLVENRGRVLEKGVMLDRIWPDTFVEENSLSKNISLLRRLLDEGSGDRRYIETLPRRGYRFNADVREVFGGREEDRAGGGGSARGVAGTPRPDPPGGPNVPGAVAVLPFVTHGAGLSEDYLGIGLADALITQLSNTGAVVVRPTSAVRKFAGPDRDSVAAGRELGVEAVIEGSVQQAGSRVRVTVQAVSVHDGAPIWADKFDTEFTHIFDVQDSISAQVARALTLKLSAEQGGLLTKRYTRSVSAYREYLKGRHFWNVRTAEGFRRAVECYESAIARDHTFALAYAGLADCYNFLPPWNILPPGECYPRAREAAEKALSFDAALPEAHAALGYTLANYDWDWGRAEAAFRRAVALNPHHESARLWYATLLWKFERFGESLAHLEHLRGIDPGSAIINIKLGIFHYAARDYDAAIRQHLRTLEAHPEHFLLHFHLGLAYKEKGLYEEAAAEFGRVIDMTGREPYAVAALGVTYAAAGRVGDARLMLKELEGAAPARYVAPYNLAAIHVTLGEPGRALALLEQAVGERDLNVTSLRVDPDFKALGGEARFVSLLRRVGLAT
jgi:DNA-binding winged helix-turn-helix (wHTH) protein/TolB-like protein/tetratricopeptide (TPR) repeat protein